MPQPAPSSRAVFRACVVNAVRGGEALMQQLVKVTQGALSGEESTVRDIRQRDLVSDSLRSLNRHEAALVKGYPMALLEIFAEGPATAKGRAPADDTGMDFGELSLMDENEMQAQVELSKAQQSALHATDAVLAELNTLVSSASTASVACRRWWATLACLPKCASSGCSTCATCWAGCWSMNTRRLPPVSASMG
jgi:hypothetical protein